MPGATRSARNRLAALLSVAVIGTSATSLLRLIGWGYPVELLSHFQMQYVLACLVGCAGFLAMRRLRAAGAAAVATLITAMPLAPYVSADGGGGSGAAHAASPGPASPTVRVLLSNVLTTNRAYDRVLALVEREDPDLVVLQEVDQRWLDALAPLEARYAWRVVDPSVDPFGMVVFSRLRLEDVQVQVMGEARRPTFVMTARVEGEAVSIVCTHPKQPLFRRSFRLRNDQLAEVGRLTGPLPRPLLLVGDLNVTMWSPWFQRLQEQTGLRSARHGHGILPSWPTFAPAAMRIPIDHVLVSDDVSVRSARLGPDVGSDHLPVIVDLSISASPSF